MRKFLRFNSLSRNKISLIYVVIGEFMEKNLEISWTGLWRLAGMVALASIFYYALDIWIAVLLAIVISSALDTSVTWLERKRIPRVVGTLAIYILLLLALALVLYTLVPLALSELSVLLKSLGKFDGTALGLENATRLVNVVNESLNRLTGILLSGNISFLNILSQFIGGVSLAVAVFVLSFYLTVDRDGVEKFLLEVMPAGYEERVLNIYYRTRAKIGQWLYGQVFLSLTVGTAVFAGLWMIGVKYSLVLGILAGLLEIVPYVGPILSGLIAFAIAASDSLSSGLYVFILFVIIQQAEGTLLVPVLMRLTTSVHPAAVLISLLVGAKLFGFVGIILAVPLTVTLQELVDSWANEKTKRKSAPLV